MDTALMPADEWSKLNFGEVDLKDARRTRRLLAVAEKLAENPAGTLPQALPEWKDLKAAYRLFDQEEVAFTQVLEPHWKRTRQSCMEPGQYLWIEDTTTLDFTNHRALGDVGRIGNDEGRGFFLHTTLVVKIHWLHETTAKLTMVGLAAQHCLVRSDQPTAGEGIRIDRERKKRRFSRARESERWAQVLSQCDDARPEAQCIYVADRESDIYEVFTRCRQRKFDFIIRACQARALANEGGSVFRAAAEGKLMGQIQIALRSRPGVSARTAALELRTATVQLRGPYRPGGKTPPVAVNVVAAKEIDPPKGVDAIHWVLLTSLPMTSLNAALQAVSLYSRRWLVEEYHKALKSGARIESSQLEKRSRIEALLSILSLVALRLLETKLLMEAQPNQVITAQDIDPNLLRLLEKKFGKPPSGWTYRHLLVCIARLGGFLARTNDGDPGWQTIWRGWHRLMIMLDGIELSQNKCG
jgi:hypothetical protein